MAVEAKRGCGFRRQGGIYLVGSGGGMPCDRLPIPLSVCPTCSHGIKQSRGFTWVAVNELIGGVHQNCKDKFPCPLCFATSTMGKAGLLWIGESFYPTPESFEREARELGLSRRIHVIPRNFKLGETWILLAHSKGDCIPCKACRGSGLAIVDGVVITELCPECEGDRYIIKPAIIKVWKPERIEKILPESMRGSEEVAELEERGITPVFVPTDDPDHRAKGVIYEGEEEDEG